VNNAFFERIFFGRPLERRLIIASILGIIGVACMFWPEVQSFGLQDESVYGIFLSVIAVTFASLGNMAAIVCTSRDLPVVTVNAHGMAWGALTSAGIAVVLGREIEFVFQPEYIASLLYLAIFGSAIAFGCYLALLRTIGSARAAYTSVLFPVVALLVSTLVEDYQWTASALAGIVFIIAGNWLALTRIERP
jgi:drug/metabolite transporter (DMT)-like permease